MYCPVVVPSMKRRQIGWFVAATMVGSVLLLLLEVDVTKGDWIDPDTPEEAYKTSPYTMVPPEIPKKMKKKKKKVIRHPHHNVTWPTWAPTEEPTVSPEPTLAPTVPTTPPTPYPTGIPNSFELVFSDEFNTPNRRFDDGNDPRWTALSKNDYTNDALHYYSPDNIGTNDNGELVITTEAYDTPIVGFNDKLGKKEKVTKHFKSAMVQTWNKFCFTGGIIEAEAILPGDANVGGLWPAFWLLGNLARHTYVASSEHIWPWSTSVCTRQARNSQHINACSKTSHYGLDLHTGRGSPEMDIFEVQPGSIKANTGVFLESPVGNPFMSASYQVAPGRPYNRPGGGFWPGPGQWYDGLVGGNNASLNILFYGAYNHFQNALHPSKADYWSDAISYNRQLTEDHFKNPHVYRLEWDVPSNVTGFEEYGKEDGELTNGYLRWYVDGQLVLSIDGKSIVNSGLGSSISSEPSYILFNTAVSKQWGFPLKCPTSCPCKNYDCHSNNWADKCGFSGGFCNMMLNETNKPKYRVNWVRVYQNPNDKKQKIGCSTPERPTRRYIEAHADQYKTADDAHMLKPIVNGGGKCNSKNGNDNVCGGPTHGTCHPKGNYCVCNQGYTGPTCLAADGFDDIVYDLPDKLGDIGFMAPSFLVSKFLLVCIAVSVVLLLLSIVSRRRLDGYKTIP